MHADDVVPRLTVENYARLLEELASPDCKGAQEELPAALAVVQHLSALLRRTTTNSDDSNGSAGGGGIGVKAGSSSGSKGRAQAAEAALRGAAGELRQQADSGDAAAGAAGGEGAPLELVRVDSEEFSCQQYHAHCPGAIVFMHRLPAGSASGNGGGGGDGGGSTAEEREEVGADVAASLIDCRHPVLLRIRLTSRLIVDHFIVPDMGPAFCAALDALAERAGNGSQLERAGERHAAAGVRLDAALAEADMRAARQRGSSPASFPLGEASFMPPASHALA